VAGLLDLLHTLTAGLRCLGSNDIDLYRLRVWLAAQLILENPGLVPFEQGDFDGDYIAPAEEGQRLATGLTAVGQRVAVESADYFAVEEPANALVERIGPFWTDDHSLVRYDVFRMVTADWMALDQFSASGTTVPLFRVPASSSPTADGRLLVAPGTVWIAAHLLAPDLDGFVGLRVAEGELKLGGPLPEPADDIAALPLGMAWTMMLKPEKAPIDGGAGPVVFLPELTLASDGTVSLNGSASITTLLGTLDLPPAGAPGATADGIAIPLGGSGKVDIRSTATAVLKLRGTHELTAASWVLPRAAFGVFLGEARDDHRGHERGIELARRRAAGVAIA
jgi:hypothetical protein